MRSETEERAAVVAEALSWLGTPWHHRGRVKGAGVDCAQFVIAAYVGAGMIEDFDTGEYPRDWHVHRDEERDGHKIAVLNAKPVRPCMSPETATIATDNAPQSQTVGMILRKRARAKLDAVAPSAENAIT